MTKKETVKIYEDAIYTYGKDGQLIVAIEEMATLIQAICKWKRGTTWADHIAEEMADVEIMLEQMKMIFDNRTAVKEWKKRKLIKLRTRMDNYQ